MSLQNIFQETAIDHALDQAAARYHKLLLIVGNQGSGKTALLRRISERKQCTLAYSNIGNYTDHFVAKKRGVHEIQ